jgi:hypothetical protein
MTDEQIRRFWASARLEGGCLVWMKSRRRNGYGQVMISDRNRTAHRVAFELTYGSIPDGALVDHICRNRACIDPAHLRLATVKQNAENRADNPHTTSGFRGVSWDKQRRCWVATVTHNYRTVNLGRFSDIHEAAKAASDARDRLFTHN